MKSATIAEAAGAATAGGAVAGDERGREVRSARASRIAVLPWSYVRRLVHAGAISRAELLTPAHRLACGVEALEVSRPCGWPAAPSLLPDGRRWHLLTSTDAAVLGMGPDEGMSPRRVTQVVDHGQVSPGDRIFALRVVWDPTAVPRAPARLMSGPAGRPAADGGARREASDGRAGARAATNAPPGPAGRAPPAGKPAGVVPAAYAALGGEKRSEADARATLAVQRLRAGMGTGGLLGWWSRVAGGWRIRRWIASLSGRVVNEQLWGVAPPACALAERAVRDWASDALRACGHEGAEAEVDEWAVFWLRRK